MDSQEVVQRIKKYEIPQCSIDELHENLNQICVDVKCDPENFFAPLCQGCIEDKHHSQQQYHSSRQLKRVLLDVYKEASNQTSNLGNQESIQEKLTLLSTTFQEIGQYCFTVSDELKAKIKEIEDKSKEEQLEKKNIQKLLDDLLKKSEEEYLKTQLANLRKTIKISNDKIQVNNEKFEQEWRALTINTNKQIRVCEQLVQRLKQTGILNFELDKCQNTPLPPLQNNTSLSTSDQLQNDSYQQQSSSQQQQQQVFIPQNQPVLIQSQSPVLQSPGLNTDQPVSIQASTNNTTTNNTTYNNVNQIPYQQQQQPANPVYIQQINQSSQNQPQQYQQQTVQQNQVYQAPQQQIIQNLQQITTRSQQQPPQQQQQLSQNSQQSLTSSQRSDQSFVSDQLIQIGFSQILKSPSIVIIDKKIAKQTETSYETNRVALIEPGLTLQKKHFFAFQIIAQTGWMGVGIARKKVVSESQYGFNYEDSKNGQYMISSNGYKWVHNNDAENGQQISFSFTQFDILLCEFDPFNKRLRFKKKGSDKMALVQVDIQQGDEEEFYMSVNLSDKDDSIGMFIDDKNANQ